VAVAMAMVVIRKEGHELSLYLIYAGYVASVLGSGHDCSSS